MTRPAESGHQVRAISTTMQDRQTRLTLVDGGYKAAIPCGNRRITRSEHRSSRRLQPMARPAESSHQVQAISIASQDRHLGWLW